MASRDGVGILRSRRRNGKQPACEPCRKAKIACDHTTPICERCRRRKISSKCIYLDAPMTGITKKPETTIAVPNNAVPRAATDSPSIHKRNTSFSLHAGIGGSSRSSEAARTPNGPETFVKGSGFFGPTNFSAIFQENRENLGNEVIQISNDSDPYCPSFESLQSQTFLMLAGSTCNPCRTSPRVALGVKVLRALPDQNTCKFLLEWYKAHSREGVFHKPTVLACASSLWDTFGKQLTEPRAVEDLEYVSRILCTNAETAAREDFDSYDVWLESLSGTNLRWETLGSIFGALTSATLSLQERDAFFCTQRGLRSNRKDFAMEMKDCVHACIVLSNYMDLINMQMVALLVKNLILQTVLSGDTSLLVWRQVGDLCSASTALGLHRDVEPFTTHTFISELRRRLFLVVFNIDKGSSLLTGRPPALSHRYCRYTPPLDISEESMMNETTFRQAVSELDENGWNTLGKLYPSTWARASASLSVILNEILEVSLGDLDTCTSTTITNLKDKLERAYLSLPPFIRWTPELLHSTDGCDEKFFHRLCTRQQFLEYKLLLERLSYKQHLCGGQAMINSAREMLDLVVLIWVQRDRFVEHHHDYDWMLMCWGIPSAGVLCVQLLKQIRECPTSSSLVLPRSEIVQNLSLLIGFLEWVRPAAGNYQICGRMRHIIKRILDQILNPSPLSSQDSLPPANSSAGTGTSGGGEAAGKLEQVAPADFDASVFDAGTFGDGLDNLDWLNSVDWSRGPWIDLGGQDYSAARWA